MLVFDELLELDFGLEIRGDDVAFEQVLAYVAKVSHFIFLRAELVSGKLF